MEISTLQLAALAASIAFVHTLIGPDHYVPFTAMALARRWSVPKTVIITTICGLGHVVGSIALGFIGIGIGVAVGRLEAIEAVRGDVAAWAFVVFGLVYGAWGLKRAFTRTAHTHGHDVGGKTNITPWTLFVIFALGPCEPLIPLLMYPAAHNSVSSVVLVAGVFSVVTVATMVAAVLVSLVGVKWVPVSGLQRYVHAITGGTISLCGAAILAGL